MATPTINFDEKRSWAWLKSEIVTTNPAADGQKVASIDDLVYDWASGIYRVSSVAPVTNIATLELKIRFATGTMLDTSNDSLISSLTIYQPQVATRIFFDTSVVPATMSVDPQYVARGSEATTMQLFIGTDITSTTGRVISERYNGNGDFVSTVIPLVNLVAGQDTAKRPVVFSTTEPLKNGEIVTAVLYNATMGAVGTQPFIISESGAIFASDSGTKYITGIEIRSPLIDASDNRLIRNPLNVPFQTTLLEAWLLYSDGSDLKVNIDGSKCKLHGTSNFNVSILGAPKNIVLSYYPDPGEPRINTGGGDLSHLSVIYKLLNKATDTSFTLKVFIVPTYISVAAGYQFKYYLTNLAGDLAVDVTANVTAKNQRSQNVEGTDYGNLQNVQVLLNMDVVLPGVYPSHIHTQMFDLTLAIPGTTGFSPYVIDYIGDDVSTYGVNRVIHGSTVGNGIVNVGLGETVLAVWLDDAYEPIHPLYDVTVQLDPPVPTHAILMYGGMEHEIELSTEYNVNVSLPSGSPVLNANSTMTLRWILRDGSDDKILGYSPMIIKLDL